MTAKKSMVSMERIESQIFLVRGQKVMLSMHLAELYDVEPRALVQAVKRNISRFPEDFMFRLSADEASVLKSQSVILKRSSSQPSRSQIVILKRGQNIKYLPYAFTEQGVAMLSSVLRSKRAVMVNIEIMRAFVRLRQILGAHIVSPTRGVEVVLVFVLFHQRLCGPLANSLFHHRPDHNFQPDSKLEAAVHKADVSIRNVIQLLEAA